MGGGRGSAVPPGDNYYPLRDWVRDQVRELIGEGRLLPGQRLIETALAEEFQVSRIPVREALRSLETEGLVTTVPRRGVVVTQLSRQDVEHLYDVRAVLEPLAFRMAALHATARDKAELHDVVQQTVHSVARGDHRETVRLNSQFHQSVTRMARNPFLTSSLQPLNGRLQWLISHGYEDERDVAEHTALLLAIEAGDGDEAARLTSLHIEAGRRHGLRSFDQQAALLSPAEGSGV
jgi:DNA-binding GntR family transcriptional regulator